MLSSFLVLATLVQNIEPSIPRGFEPEIVSGVTLHPGKLGIPAVPRFR